MFHHVRDNYIIQCICLEFQSISCVEQFELFSSLPLHIWQSQWLNHRRNVRCRRLTYVLCHSSKPAPLIPSLQGRYQTMALLLHFHTSLKKSILSSYSETSWHWSWRFLNPRKASPDNTVSKDVIDGEEPTKDRPERREPSTGHMNSTSHEFTIQFTLIPPNLKVLEFIVFSSVSLISIGLFIVS